jgi:hypothetical protein
MDAQATKGLLKHALQYNSQVQDIEEKDASGLSQASAYGEDQGITPAERREIMARIEKVAERRSLSTESAEADNAPQKKELLFPLLVNILVLGFTAFAVLGISYVFRQRNAQAESASAVVTTAEGRLIQELKRDSDSKLQEKERDIAEVQSQLRAVDKQRDELSTNIDQQVEARESELRVSLNAAIEKERARLTELGNSEMAIQAKLKKFEQDKTSEMDSQLAAAKKKAEADKEAQEARLAQISQEYQKSIAGMNEERNRILGQAKSREDALRASLETKTAELAGQSAAAKAELEQAKARLERIEDERSKAQGAEDRILGLYSSIQAALSDHRYQDALSSISALESYLNDPKILEIPSVRSRRGADLFIADALGSLAKSELQSSSADTTRLLDQAALVSSARAAAEAGRKAAQAGDTATADAEYRDCLTKIPEILSASDYFAGKAKAEESARRTRLDSALAAADRAWKSGDSPGAIARYKEALSYLDLDSGTQAAMVTRIGQASEEAAIDSRKASDSNAAREEFAAAGKSLTKGEWAPAIAGFIGVIGAYPSAAQVPDALKGIEAAREGIDKDEQVRDSKYEAELAGVRAGSIDAKDAGTINSEDSKQLAALRTQLDDLKRRYAAFMEGSGSSRSSDSEEALLERQKRLAAFLGSGEVKAIFPELERAVDEQVMAYRQRISIEELRTIADIAIRAAGSASAQQRQSFLESNAKHYKDDPTISGFIAALRDMLKQS